MKKLLLLLAFSASAIVMATTPQGALNGKFTINANGDQVVFSQGNLQYMAASMMYRFADNQYDTIGSANANIDPRNRTAIDLFGWGTGANPTQASTSDADYATFIDWGTNSISNGGSQENLWRTLNADEWTYIFFTRSNAATLFGHGTVNGIKGLIILPDDWQTPARMTFTSSTAAGMTNQGSYYGNTTMDFFTTNTYTDREWYIMQSSGAVFLPVAGERNGTACNFSNFAQYWASSTKLNNAGVAIGGSALSFGPYDVVPSNGYNQHLGHAVRLVHDEPAAVTPVVECPEAHFNLNGAEVMTLHVGDVVSIPTLMGATGSIYRLSSKTVEGIRVAELTDDDMIHATGVGTATFIGLYIHTENGQTIQCEYSFSIVVEAGVQLQDPELSFTPAEVEAEIGAPFTAPTLNNPHNVPIDKWYGSNNLVLTVDEQTGAVTIVGVGTAQVYCESNATDTYKRSAAYYTVNVTTMGLVVGGVTVTNSNAGDIFGNGSISYDKITHTLTMTNAVVSAPISPLGVPSVQGAPQDNTQGAAIEYTLRNEPLTIMLNGGNAINNTAIGIMASYAPVVMRSTNNGSLRMSANTVTVKAPALKISQCTVIAYSSSTGIGVETLSVDKGSTLVADGQSMAIQAQYFEKASDNNGEGIDILTAGVEFVAKKGFYNTADNTYAKHVEIGKVVVVPTTEEVTTIDFTQTDPEGNETVIFSGSVNDTYNESTGQLEISTSLTDEEVASALDSVIPGSSAWIDLLPGSLVFDIPAGQGKIRVQCMTLPGYSLQVKMEGYAAVSITQLSLGWAEVNYNVTEPIHVVIYLHAESPSSAPARIATNTQDGDPNVGAYIQAVKIAPQDAPDPNPQTAIDIIETNQAENGKVLMNGVLYILRDGKIFNALGMEIR